MSVHVSTAVEIMDLISAKNPVTKTGLCKTKISFKKRGIINQVMVAVMEDVLMVAAIFKAKEV